MVPLSSALLGGTPEQYIIPCSTRFVSDEAYKELVDVLGTIQRSSVPMPLWFGPELHQLRPELAADRVA